MVAEEKHTRLEQKSSSRSDSSETLVQESLDSQKGTLIQSAAERTLDSAGQYLPTLNLSGHPDERQKNSNALGTQSDGVQKSETKSLQEQHKEFIERLESIENSRLVAQHHEGRLKLGIDNTQKELDSSNFADGLMGTSNRQEHELTHKREELKNVQARENSAQKVMNGASVQIVTAETLVIRERQERECGDLEKADATAKEAQQQMQQVMQITEGVSYTTKAELEQSGKNREAELAEHENFKDNLKLTKVVADTVRDGAIASAATLASGGTLAPLAAECGAGLRVISAIGAGTTAGTVVGATSRFGEAVSDIQANQKTPDKAFNEAAQNTVRDFKTALIDSASTVAGLGANSRLLTGLSTESSIIKSVSGGAVAGGTQASVSTGLSTTERYLGAKADFDRKYSDLPPQEREKRWDEFKKENQLTDGDIAKQAVTDITTGLVAGAVGGRVEAGKQSATGLSGKTLWTTADVASDAAVTAGSAKLAATLNDQDVTADNLAAAASGVATSRLAGGMAARIHNEPSAQREHHENSDVQHNSATSKTPADLYHQENDSPQNKASDSTSLTDQIPLPHDRNKLQEMRKALVTDHVSGLLNQEGTQIAIEAGLQKALKDNSPYTVIGIDLNGLKDFNDTYGHHTGDLALRAAGDYLNSRLHRSSDVKGRLHGDEFLAGVAASEEQLAFLKKEMKDVKLAVEVKRDANANVQLDEKGKVVAAGVRIVKPGDTIRPDETIILNSGISAGFQELTPELRQFKGEKLREEMEKRADRNMYDTKMEKRTENAKLQQEVAAAGKDLNGELKKKIQSVPPTEFKLSENSRHLSDRLKEGAGLLRNAIPVELARPIYARRLEDSATKVPETGLLRKWAADQRSEHLIKAAAGENPPKPVTVVSMDLDGLKNLNDNYGHDAGSQMITAFGKWLNKRGRADDVVSHPYAADEFEITALNAAPEQMQAFQRQLDGLRFVGHFEGKGKEKSVSGIRVLRPGEGMAEGESVIPYAGVCVGMASVKPELMSNPKQAYARAQEEADRNVLQDKERRLAEGKRIPRKQN